MEPIFQTEEQEEVITLTATTTIDKTIIITVAIIQGTLDPESITTTHHVSITMGDIEARETPLIKRNWLNCTGSKERLRRLDLI